MPHPFRGYTLIRCHSINKKLSFQPLFPKIYELTARHAKTIVPESASVRKVKRQDE